MCYINRLFHLGGMLYMSKGSIGGAEEAGAIGLGEVAEADNLAVAGVETGLDSVQKIRLAVLEVAAQGKGAKVGQLDHAGKGGIDK